MPERPAAYTNQLESKERRGGVRSARAVVFVGVALLLPACGGASDGGGGTSELELERATEAAYQKAYTDAWVQACKAAVAEIRKAPKRPGGARAAKVSCARPVEQMEGNTSFEPEQAAAEGNQQGSFDGCAYAWDETYGSSGEVESQC